MKWKIEKEKLFIIDESKINADESYVYNLIVNHFFNNDSNIYVTNNKKLKFFVTYESFLNNKFDLQKMFIKDFVFINKDDNNQIIEQKFKNTNFNYLPVLDDDNNLLYELKLNKNSDELWITKNRWNILYKDNNKVAMTLNKYKFKEIYVMWNLKSLLYNYIIINTGFKGKHGIYTPNTLRWDIAFNELKKYLVSQNEFTKEANIALDPIGAYRMLARGKIDSDRCHEIADNPLLFYSAQAVHIPNRYEINKDLGILCDEQDLEEISLRIKRK